MKKKILSVILAIGLIASIAGCGNEEKVEENKNTDIKVEAESSEAETEEKESADMTDSNVMPDGNAETEASYNPDDLEEEKDIFVVKHIDTGDGTEIDFTNQEIIDGPFMLGDSIDIYSFYFTYAGYTKPNIKIDGVWKVDEWIVVPFAESSFLVKEEDFNRVATLKETSDNKANEDLANAAMEAASKEQANGSSQNEGSANTANEVAPAPETEAQPETPAPAVPTYSEAEVINIVEGALRDAGFRKPEEKMTADELAMFGPTAGMGWGIDNIPMNDPYMAASQIVEGFQFAGWTTYYIENQGSSDGYVHLKLYSGS